MKSGACALRQRSHPRLSPVPDMRDVGVRRTLRIWRITCIRCCFRLSDAGRGWYGRLHPQHRRCQGLTPVLYVRASDDMLDYARLRRGQLDIVPTVVDIRGLVSGLLAAHRAMAKVPLVDSVVKSVPTHCYLDELRLRQVLQNGKTPCDSAADNGDCPPDALARQESRTRASTWRRGRSRSASD